jgi:hypothetical protein
MCCASIDNAFQLWIPRPVNFRGAVPDWLLHFDDGAAGQPVAWPLVASVAFAFSSYFHHVILEAGHNTKAHAIGYMAPALSRNHLGLPRKVAAGGFAHRPVYGAANSRQPRADNLLLRLPSHVRGHSIAGGCHQGEKRRAYWIKTSAVLLVVMVVHGSDAKQLCQLVQHLGVRKIHHPWGDRFNHSYRMEAAIKHIATAGLDRDYVTQWSYGIQESLSLSYSQCKRWFIWTDR